MLHSAGFGADRPGCGLVVGEQGSALGALRHRRGAGTDGFAPGGWPAADRITGNRTKARRPWYR